MIYLVACTEQKLLKGKPLPAKELYTASTWFKVARAAVEKHADSWYILSAKFGLLDPEEPISRYNRYLGRLTLKERIEWATEVAYQLLSLDTSDRSVAIVGSALYVNTLRPALEAAGFRVHAPLAGMGLGAQKRFLSAKAK